MTLLAALVLAAAVDGEAALGHAAALAALGPHPWGSPRNEAAAEYVAVELRDVGLSTVQRQAFEKGGIRGTNVIGTLRGPGDEVVVVCAHHDTAPGSPGAYDDGGGVGLLIEVARVMTREPSRTRSLVFASFDGEEAWATGEGRTEGSRAWLERLGPESRRIVAVVAIEMSGWEGGSPVLHPIAYPDPRRAGRSAVVAPGWLVSALLAGSREAGAALAVGDPLLSWLYQPAVRTFRSTLYGDDLSFLQAGLPAVMVSDSSFSAFYPHYHQRTDTAEKLDSAALGRMGTAVVGALRALEREPAGPREEPSWYAALGQVLGFGVLAGVALASVLPGLRTGLTGGPPVLWARVVQAGLFGLLFWRHPVPALWIFFLPNAVLPLGRARWATLLAVFPAAALLALGAAAWWRGLVTGVWLNAFEIVALILAFALAFVRPAGTGKRKKKKKKRR